jgi:hypothetical protein
MRCFSVLALFMFSGSAFSASITGPIILKYVDSPFAKEVFTKEFGDTVKVTCNWRAGEFFGNESVFASVTLKNSGKKTMYYNYYVTFFDKENKIVGASGQGSFGGEGLAPGKEEQLGSCIIALPKNRYKDIASYQAIFYETDVPPAK